MVPVAFGSAGEAYAQGVAVDDATPAQKKQAQDKYAEGTRYYTARQFENAYESFKASYGVVASPNSHMMMARSLGEMGRSADAYNELTLVEKRARKAAAADPKYQSTADKAAELRRELASKVALVKFNVIGGDEGGGAGAVKVDGVEVPRKHWSTARAYEPGSYSVEGSFAGAVRGTRTVELTAGSEEMIDVDVREAGSDEPAGSAVAAPAERSIPKQPDESSSGSGALMPLATVAAGVGVAGFAMFAITGAMNQSTFDDVEARCTSDNQCPPEVQEDIDKGETLQTLANVGLVIGAVGLVTGITLFSIHLASDDGGSEEVATAGRVTVGATVTPLGSWATARGTF